MADPVRYSVVAPLPSLGGFRRAVALDAERDRAVVLAWAPADLTADAARREALEARARAASALRHPGVAAVLGAEAADGALALVEEHRPGTPLRALLDTGGRLPADLAVRILLDAAEGVARAHATDAGAARLTHGALDPSAIVVSDDGPAFVVGFGIAAGGDPAADVRALGAILHECVAGEPAGAPPRKVDVPGLPATVAAAVDRATGADAPSLPTVSAFAEALAAAIGPAPHHAVAAYADAVLPPDAGDRARIRRTISAALAGDVPEASAELLAPGPPPVPAPAPAREPARESARTFAAPSPRPPARWPLVALALVALAAGFTAGYLGQRASRPEPPAPPGASARPAAAR